MDLVDSSELSVEAQISFFGGIPGKALSGILTASDYAKLEKERVGKIWEGLQDFGEKCSRIW